MFDTMPERDWKVFRRLRETALERYCERVLKEVGEIAAYDGRSFHKRYLAIYRLIQDRDETLAFAFNNPRRSAARMQLAVMQRHELLTADEIAEFSEETREFLQRVTKEN